MNNSVVIHWFRQDLRLSDNPALTAASKNSGAVFPIYILDDINSKTFSMGAASRVWLHHSIESLNNSLNGSLSIYRGHPGVILQDIIRLYDVQAVFWNSCYEPWRIERDKEIIQILQKRGVGVKSFNGSLLWDPCEIKKDDGMPYKVFTPFFRKGCLRSKNPRKPLPKPKGVKYRHDRDNSLSIEQLQLLPIIRWDKRIKQYWKIGESGAQEQFLRFRKEGLVRYKYGRNLPASDFVSRLSPYLHFGEISPNQIWYGVRDSINDENRDHFCSELGWREFSYNQLYQNPDLPTKNLQSKFDRFPWKKDQILLKAWQNGQTGVPMVDAGMRELWETGYMHNRVRMIAASFLVKNLLLHWRHGERWFWDTLLDADLANNSASWQWVAGCGADAAPYFRIFNPVLQSKKFDPEGKYIRKFLPEISLLPNKYIGNPWEAPEHVLKKANVILGFNYPKPIVDISMSRIEALEAFQSL